MYEALPTPYGLVRFGVAPDHPEVKNCIDKFTEIANHPSFTFIGNTRIGNEPHQLPLSTLAPHYNAMLFSYGASEDRQLHIPGESLNRVLSARAFVSWYNGLPEYADMAPPLSESEEAVIIGQGNVALDVARVLLSPLEQLKQTDMTESALATLSRSRVKRVKIVGRRGPLQAPYTIKEVRELLHLPSVSFPGIDESLLLTSNLKKLPRQLMRVAQLLQKGSPVEKSQAAKEWELKYMLSPVSFSPSSTDPSSLGAVDFDQTTFSDDLSKIDLSDLNALRSMRVQKAHDSDAVSLPADIAFKSVGYKSTPLSGFSDLGIPFDDRMGIIPNDRAGRVLSPALGPGDMTAGHVPGMYCAGWVKRGPTGVIASTMEDAFTTAEAVSQDWADSAQFIGDREQDCMKGGWENVKSEADQRGIRSINWNDWEIIDKEEKRRGQESGKEREKCKSVAEMIKILDG
ncbi:hypothetical protein AAFC00_002282 [Neodothiora populina]